MITIKNCLHFSRVVIHCLHILKVTHMVWAHLWCAPARARSFCFHLWQWRVHFTNIREHDELSFVLVAQSTLQSWFSISTNATNGDQIHAEMWSFKHKREIGGGFGLFFPSHSHSCCWCWFVLCFVAFCGQLASSWNKQQNMYMEYQFHISYQQISLHSHTTPNDVNVRSSTKDTSNDQREKRRHVTHHLFS